MDKIVFLNDKGDFSIKNPENTSYLYFPLASEKGLKSAVTPNFGGDAKVDQETFLLEPVSSENLHNNRSARNFWCVMEDGSAFSVTGNSAEQEMARWSSKQDKTEMKAGFMWQTICRVPEDHALSAEVTSFVPVDHNVEIMHVTIQNESEEAVCFTPYAAIPVYGRSADNLRDHRNVTSMLHRIYTTEDTIMVCPTMSFDEKGHRENHMIYYVSGWNECGEKPEAFYPTVEDYVGEGGTYTHPRAVYEQTKGVPSGTFAAGKEAMGAFRFKKVSLEPGKKTEYIVLLGVEQNEDDIHTVQQMFDRADKVKSALRKTQDYWNDKVCIRFHSKEKDFDSYMRWVSLQPFLRRLFGCSYLPHHDYGRGGRGWRDLWQDCLSLLLMDPEDVGRMIENNFCGVRIDGTNATIIGSAEGEFLADRNGITRVWMDHALWPLITTQIYVHQTGDVAVLNKKVSYFKDAQVLRGTQTDTAWTEDEGNVQRTQKNEIYEGSIVEHLLIQQLTAFYEVGSHNIYRLRGADWNDALDMASERGESAAFTYAYAGNLRSLSKLLSLMKEKTGTEYIEILKETEILLNDSEDVFKNTELKSEILKQYGEACRHTVSGDVSMVSVDELICNLNKKAEWLVGHLRKQEWMEGKDQDGWFNSYYDNHGKRVEGYFDDQVRMMLIGQVFAIMSGTATDEQIRKIIKAADRYLYKEDVGGYRLNTDFKELKFDMGRMFGFAYGEKENGAVFSHMTVMFANALYQRGFAEYGWKALYTLLKTAMNFEVSRIYPGIPEYFRADGRGMYHYLTGAASWYLMTMVIEVYGAYGICGDLVLSPRLLSTQFDETGEASIEIPFAGKKLKIVYRNPERKEFSEYHIAEAWCDQKKLQDVTEERVLILRKDLLSMSDDLHEITVLLK